jgi:hypothetical protein
MCNFKRLVKGVVIREYAINNLALAFNGVIAVQLDHGSAGGHGVRTVNLDLVIVLGGRGERGCNGARGTAANGCAQAEGGWHGLLLTVPSRFAMAPKP